MANGAWIAGAAALAFCAIGPAAQAADPSPSYTITHAIPLGGGERWDFVTFDPTSNRAFIAHGDHVTVVDVKAGTVAGEIGTFPGGTHGIGIATATGQGYSDDGKGGTASAFDLATLKLVKRIPAAPDADDIVFDPASGHIFVINGDSGSITVIDPATNAAIATIDVGAALEAGAVDGVGKLYVNGAAKNEIVTIDTAKNTVEAHWPMPDCKRPRGLAIDTRTRRIFATCLNKALVVVDADSGANLAALPIGSGSDGAVFDPVRQWIISANVEGTLTVIAEKDAHTFVPLGTVKTMPSARTIAIDPRTGRLFLPAAEIAKTDPPTTAGGRPHVTFAPGSLKLLMLDPTP
ncbi:MAG TPA: YncE family protein [Stellaceae bacterium]|nr:YncE family protein [Stellaceae bacterium]